MNWEQKEQLLVNWVRQKVTAAGAKGLVIGLSGGIDSSVVAALCKRAFPENVVGVILPCYSNNEDAQCGKLAAEAFGIPYYVVNLGDAFTCLLDNIKSVTDKEADLITVANIKPRLRMTTLYYFAGLFNYLVAGTGNKSELEIGYFTKYGDGGVDLEPIGNLLKTDVRELARYLHVPQKIIDKKPSAGLWEDQTDEEEMGISYEELDQFLMTGSGSAKIKERVKELQGRSEHKRHVPPVPVLF